MNERLEIDESGESESVGQNSLRWSLHGISDFLEFLGVRGL